MKTPLEEEPITTTPALEAAPTDFTDFESAAAAIGRELLATAEEHEDGSIGWGRGMDRDRRPIRDGGPFSGRCGEGLFLAALYAVGGDETFAVAARRALRGLVRGAPDPAYREHLSRRLSIGLTGLGGLIYVLVRAGRWLDDPEVTAAAKDLARALTPERADAEGRYDFIWGNAGAALALLALAETAGEEGPAVVALARRCAEPLLSARTRDPGSGHRAWPTLREVPSTGFAHGAAGIVQALLRLYRATGEDELYHAAVEAMAFERSLWLSERDNVLASGHELDRDADFGWGWCHGAPGTVFPRLEILDLLQGDGEAGIAADLSRALPATAVADLPGTDTLCCGWFGRIDVLLEAGRALGNPSLTATAHKLARLRLARAQEVGGFIYNPRDDLDVHRRAGLWQGPAGTGYMLLRLEHPDLLPSILKMD